MFFELLPKDSTTPIPAWEAQVGGYYELVVTSYSGLCRCRLGDMVKVHAMYGKMPIVRWANTKYEQQCWERQDVSEERRNDVFFVDLQAFRDVKFEHVPEPVRAKSSVMQTIRRLTGGEVPIQFHRWSQPTTWISSRASVKGLCSCRLPAAMPRLVSSDDLAGAAPADMGTTALRDDAWPRFHLYQTGWPRLVTSNV
eukprot:Skav202875  [mRNA]  locus=scaffold3541:188376:189425:- [translate_table: standard]